MVTTSMPVSIRSTAARWLSIILVARDLVLAICARSTSIERLPCSSKRVSWLAGAPRATAARIRSSWAITRPAEAFAACSSGTSPALVAADLNVARSVAIRFRIV